MFVKGLQESIFVDMRPLDHPYPPPGLIFYISDVILGLSINVCL